MKREEILAALKQIAKALHAQFEDKTGTHGARLQQLDHALGTAAMAAEALFDEEIREVDLAVRMVNQEPVHGDNVVVSPIGGRTIKDHYKVVAGRAK